MIRPILIGFLTGYVLFLLGSILECQQRQMESAHRQELILQQIRDKN